MDAKLSKKYESELKLFQEAEVEQLHVEQQVAFLKSQIKTHIDDLKECLETFQRRASDDLDKSLQTYKCVIHDVLFREELFKYAIHSGFAKLLDGYRDTLRDLSAALKRTLEHNDLQTTYDNLLKSINEKMKERPPSPPSAASASKPSLETEQHHSLDLELLKNPLMQPLLTAQSVLSNSSALNVSAAAPASASATGAGGHTKSTESRVGGVRVSLSLEKLSKEQVPKLLQIEPLEPKDKQPMVRGLHFGDVVADTTSTPIPALFVADTKKVSVFRLVEGTLPEKRELASIENASGPEWGEPCSGLLPVLGSRYLLVSEKQKAGRKHAVVLYEWTPLVDGKTTAKPAIEAFALKDVDGKVVESEGTAWLVPKKLDEKSATFYAAVSGSSQLHEIQLSDTPQLQYCGHHKLKEKGKLRSLGYRCRDGPGANVRIVASFADGTMHVYDSTGDSPDPISIERTIEIVPPPTLVKGASWNPIDPLPLGDALVFVSDKSASTKPNDRSTTVRALCARDRKCEWPFEKVDAPTDVQLKNDRLFVSAWCLARLPTTQPAAVLLVANDVSKKLEFYQLVLHANAHQ